MKKVMLTALMLCMCVLFAACSRTTTNVLTGYTTGDVELGEYMNLPYTPVEVEVTDDEVESEIEYFLSENAERTEITDRTMVEDGDIVNLDYTGYIDGETFDGGSAEGFDLVIGSGTFIDGFEDGLIGAETGTTVDVNVTFPDPYPNNTDLSGKEATFVCTINGIYEDITPELTDELVASLTDYDTVDAYREYIRASLLESEQSDADSQKEYDVLDAAVANATFVKDLTAEIEEAAESLIANYDSMFEYYYGVDALTYFSIVYGLDEDSFNEYMYSQAEVNVKYSYLLSAVAEKENLEASDDEIDALVQNMLADYGYETEEELYASLEQYYDGEGRQVVTEQVRLNMARDLMCDSAIAQ